MALTLNTIKPAKGSRKNAKRVGRGLSKGGSYSGRGVKGQRARSGVTGLQKMGIRHIMLSIKKNRGFKSQYAKAMVVNVETIAKSFPDGAKVTPQALFAKGLIPAESGKVKVLGDGEIAIKVIVEGCKVSATAKEKITKAGGSVL